MDVIDARGKEGRRTGLEIVADTKPFFEWLAAWYDELPTRRLDELCPDPQSCAVLAADVIVGFCSEGALASERVNGIVTPTARLFQRAYELGVRRFLLAQDTHAPDCPEFGAWPPHCVRGTKESTTMPELQALPFSGTFTVIEKNSLSPAVATNFQEWLEENDDLGVYLVVGDCTDLCTYNLAMAIRLWANATNRQHKRVVVDALAVQTYHVPVGAASGALPHPGDFLHMLFLYHMRLNGIEIVAAVT